MNAKETTSLMVKFVQSEFLNPEIDDTILLDIFSKFADIKDIRLIRDKFEPDKYRNFVFVEFFSIEDAQKVVEMAKKDPIRIMEERVFITYSKSKKEDEDKTGDSLYNVPESSLQFDPSKHRTPLDDDSKYLNENEIMKSDQLMPTSFNVNPAPKTQEQIDKEKAEAEIKKWEKLKKQNKANPATTEMPGLSIMNKKYENIINMGKSKPSSEKPSFNPKDYIDIHV